MVEPAHSHSDSSSLCLLPFLSHTHLKRVSGLCAKFYSVLNKVVWDSHVLFFFVYLQFKYQPNCQDCSLLWLLLNTLSCFLMQANRSAWEQSLVMQFPFSLDFIPTLNLFTSSTAVSRKPCFWFKIKDTSEITSIAMEDNERTCVAQVTKSVFSKYVNIPLQKKLNMGRSDGEGKRGTSPELNFLWDCRIHTTDWSLFLQKDYMKVTNIAIFLIMSRKLIV